MAPSAGPYRDVIPPVGAAWCKVQPTPETTPRNANGRGVTGLGGARNPFRDGPNIEPPDMFIGDGKFSDDSTFPAFAREQRTARCAFSANAAR